MAVTFDAASDGNITGIQTTLTVAHTCTGSDRGLVVFVSLGTTGGGFTGQTASCTYNGVSMTDARTGSTSAVVGTLARESISSVAWMFYLLNPASGANNIVVTTSPSFNATHFNLVAVSVTGANGVINVTPAKALSGNSPTMPVGPSVTGNLVVGGASHGDNISGVGGTTTQRAVRNDTGATSGGNIIIGTTPGTG